MPKRVTSQKNGRENRTAFGSREQNIEDHGVRIRKPLEKTVYLERCLKGLTGGNDGKHNVIGQ